MRQRAASAAAGVAALSLGFGLTSIGTHRHAPAGHKASLVGLSRASVLSVDSQNESWAAELQALETQRLADEQVAREAAEAERLAEEEHQAEEAAEAERVASEKARKAALAAHAAKVTSTTVRPVSTLPATTGGGNTSGVNINCESGGNYALNTGNGYYGAYQWLPSTFNTALRQALAQGRITQEVHDAWTGVRPDRVPAWVQDIAAAAHVAAGNRGAWPNC